MLFRVIAGKSIGSLTVYQLQLTGITQQYTIVNTTIYERIMFRK